MPPANTMLHFSNLMSPIQEDRDDIRRRRYSYNGNLPSSLQRDVLDTQDHHDHQDVIEPKSFHPKKKEHCPSKMLTGSFRNRMAKRHEHDDGDSSDEEDNDFVLLVPPNVGSLADALDIMLDGSKEAAPIREKGKVPPPVQSHQGTTFKCFYNSGDGRAATTSNDGSEDSDTSSSGSSGDETEDWLSDHEDYKDDDGEYRGKEDMGIDSNHSAKGQHLRVSWGRGQGHHRAASFSSMRSIQSIESAFISVGNHSERTNESSFNSCSHIDISARSAKSVDSIESEFFPDSERYSLRCYKSNKEK